MLDLKNKQSEGKEDRVRVGLARMRAHLHARYVSLRDKYIEMWRSKRRNTKKKSISITQKSGEINIYRTKAARACARKEEGVCERPTLLDLKGKANRHETNDRLSED